MVDFALFVKSSFLHVLELFQEAEISMKLLPNFLNSLFLVELVSSMDDPLSGLHNIKFDNKPLMHMLAHSIAQNEDYLGSLVPQIKNVSFRWWLTHQKAAPTFQAVGGLMIFLLLNFEDLCKRMLQINQVDQLNECVV